MYFRFCVRLVNADEERRCAKTAVLGCMRILSCAF